MLPKNEIFAHFKSILDYELQNSVNTCMRLENPGDDDMGFDFVTASYVGVHYGATRGAIVDDEYGYIVKFDIWDDQKYGSACDREIEVYEEAEKVGLEKYFAEPTYVGMYAYKWLGYSFDDLYNRFGWQDYKNMDEEELDELISNLKNDIEPEWHEVVLQLYAYPFVNEGFTDCYRASKESKSYQISRNSGSPLSERNVYIGAKFIDEYGEEEFQKLSDFLEWQDVNDLHSGNVGTLDGNFILMDYAGYHDC